jgi:hypothetical protein
MVPNDDLDKLGHDVPFPFPSAARHTAGASGGLGWSVMTNAATL